MVKEIRIYVEGGGEGKEARAQYRKGFHGFLNPIITLARSKRIPFTIIPCGSRSSTYEDFRTALRTHPEAFNVLLADSEGGVEVSPREHLKGQDRWDFRRVAEEQCHLMVQAMEAWLVADIQALQNYYGHEFNSKAVPRTADVERIDKGELDRCLKDATRRTKKGQYHKTRHAPDILERLNVVTVRNASAHCDRLFTILKQKIDT